MAQRVHTVLISDLSGDEVEEGLESVSFSYQGVDYVIDLTAQEAAGFDRAMAMYVEHARRSSRPSRRSGGTSVPTTSGSSGSSRTQSERIGNIKRWAADQGLEYPKRGRLPKSLVEQYDATH